MSPFQLTLSQHLPLLPSSSCYYLFRDLSSLFNIIIIFLYQLAALTLVAAQFQLQYPTPRGFSANTMSQSPCGNLPQSTNRTSLPLHGSFAIALNLYQWQTTVEVLLALGSDPGDIDQSIAIMEPFQVYGEGALCLPHVKVYEKHFSTAILGGTNGTLQVVVSGDTKETIYAVGLVSSLACNQNTDSL